MLSMTKVGIAHVREELNQLDPTDTAVMGAMVTMGCLIIKKLFNAESTEQ